MPVDPQYARHELGCTWQGSGSEKKCKDEVIMPRLKFEMSEHVRGALNPVDRRLSTSLALSAVRRRRTQAGVLYTTGHTTVTAYHCGDTI